MSMRKLSKNIHILTIINGLRYGGMERQFVEMTKYMFLHGLKIEIAVLNKPGPFSKELEVLSQGTVRYLDRRKYMIPLIIIKMARLCKAREVALIHVQDSFSAFYGLLIARLAGAKLLNGMIRHAGVSSGAEYLWERMLLVLSDQVLANSKAGLMFYGLNGTVIYNFINLERFSKSSGDLSKIVMTASFSDYKDQETLLKAGRILMREGRASQIAFIGDGIHKERLSGLVKDFGLEDIVTFCGGVSNVEEIVAEYGIGVLCSTKRYKEGVSNAILEYMGSGLIAIASDVGGTSEIIQHGVNGFLFEAENSESLYLAIKHVQDHGLKLDVLRERAIKTLIEKFNPESNCRQLLELYHAVSYDNKSKRSKSEKKL